ncbi:MAG: hypothetical protein H6661_10085 [Ardenticatenaceae bacterium]|nr:hypothetical protein [Ardenticatenaceae bacterium]
MSTADILIGPATIWYAPVGEALPDPNTVNYGDDWGGNWEKMALTKEPVTANRDVSAFDVMVEQSTLPVKRGVTEEKVTIETILAEFLAASLKLAMEGTVTTTVAGAGQVGMDEIEGGGQTTLSEYAWGIEGKYIDASGNIFPVRVFIYRGTAVLNGELQFAKGDSTGIPLRIETLGDLSKVVGKQLWKIQKVTAAATS